MYWPQPRLSTAYAIEFAPSAVSRYSIRYKSPLSALFEKLYPFVTLVDYGSPPGLILA